MEAGLDNLMTTLETDCGITSDSVPILSHDPHIQAQKCSRTDGIPYEDVAAEVLIKDLAVAEIQEQFRCDNMQPQAGAGPNTPWMAGMFWPYRSTKLTQPFRAQTSGGFEGMAITPDKHRLLPPMEKPLVGDDQRTILMHEFDLASKSYTGNRFKYQFEPRGVSIGDFILIDNQHGLVIERDNTQGDLNGFKAIYKITLGAPGTFVNKQLAVDLLRISDPHRISEPGQPGDVGIGRNFAFPFTTIEDILFFDSKHIGVLNDNNFPFSVGRHVGSGQPDDEEFIIIKLDRPL
jgi:glycerophosphoryl diester phosphodiesterase